MKRLMLFTAIIILLSGCRGEIGLHNHEIDDVVAPIIADSVDNKSQLNDSTPPAITGVAMFENPFAYEQNSTAQAIMSDCELRTSILNNTSPSSITKSKCAEAHNLNVIVQNPEMNCVTYEVDERLVGRYIAAAPTQINTDIKTPYLEGDVISFEITSDGKAEILLKTSEGTARYYSKDILLTAYYHTDVRVIIHFNLIGGGKAFPAEYGLSISFEGDYSFNSFRMLCDTSEYDIEFIKKEDLLGQKNNR